MAGPLSPIRTRQTGVALRERPHHHKGMVGGGPVGAEDDTTPLERGREGMARRGLPLVETDSRSRLQAAACAIRGRSPRSEGVAQ